MKERIYTIPFRSRSNSGDFTCPDGEIHSLSGAYLSGALTSEPSSGDDPNSSSPGYIKDFIPSVPPPPEVTFALKRETLAGWHPYPEAYPAQTMNCGTPSPESWGKVAQQLLARFRTDVLSQNLFAAPVLATAAWRLKTGALVSPSHPVKLTPDTEAPVVSATESPDNEELTLRVAAALGKIHWRLSLPETLREFSGVIESLEILVSRPLALYDPDQPMIYGKRVTSSNKTICLDSAGIPTEQPVCTDTLPFAWTPAPPSPHLKDSHISQLKDFYTVASMPLAGLKPSGSFTELPFTCGTLHDAFASESYSPSFGMQSLKGAAGALPFKGRTILWQPVVESNPPRKLSSSIWVSEKSDPPVFPDFGLQDLECGEIIAICRAFRSSGLVATVAPTLYVFTSEGIFLFKETSTGKFTDAGLIARYQLSSPDSVFMLPTGVLFTTTSGETIILSGTKAQNLSSEATESSGGKTVTIVSQGGEIKVITRPLKLSGAGNFKRMLKIFLRGQFLPARITLKIYGSRNMRQWMLLGQREGGSVVCMNPVRCRFFRVEVSGNPDAGSILEGMEVREV